jgi:DNA-directed RNA polymerase subunit RPC12/RpoP
MARRKTVNKTGILRVEGIPYHDAWVAYKCVSCQEMNYVQVGQQLLTPQEAIETAVWKCEHCGYVHSKETDLHLINFVLSAVLQLG